MAVPKRKTSKARRDSRSACKFLRPKAFATCSNCDVPLVPHVVCTTCGFYKGRKVMKTKLDRALTRGEKRRQVAPTEQTPAHEASQEAKSE